MTAHRICRLGRPVFRKESAGTCSPMCGHCPSEGDAVAPVRRYSHTTDGTDTEGGSYERLLGSNRRRRVNAGSEQWVRWERIASCIQSGDLTCMAPYPPCPTLVC